MDHHSHAIWKQEEIIEPGPQESIVKTCEFCKIECRIDRIFAPVIITMCDVCRRESCLPCIKDGNHPGKCGVCKTVISCMNNIQCILCDEKLCKPMCTIGCLHKHYSTHFK